jgi:hypothetical protein
MHLTFAILLIATWCSTTKTFNSQFDESQLMTTMSAGPTINPVQSEDLYKLGIELSKREGSIREIKQCIVSLIDLDPELGLKLINHKSIRKIIVPTDSDFKDQGQIHQRELNLPKIKYYPHYPLEARMNRIQGDVWVTVYVDDTGRVCALGDSSGPIALRKIAQFCAIQLHFRPLLENGVPKQFKISVGIPFLLR